MPLDAALAAVAAIGREAVDDTARLVREVRAHVNELIVRAARIADDVDWQAPSARGFHERVDDLQHRLISAEVRADLALDALTRARTELEARAWTTLP